MAQFRKLSQTQILFPVLGALVLSSGCIRHTVKEAVPESAQEIPTQIDLAINKDVDILFVIDNSSSMGEEQALISANFNAFVEVLQNVEANYRLGISTTDMDPKECRSNTDFPTIGAKNGMMRAKSCLDRSKEFDSVTLDSSRFNTACKQYCKHPGLETIETGIDADGDGKDDGEPTSRPWIEEIDGETNLPEGVTAAEAFQCFGPQGIHGCGVEMQLESMYRAIEETENPKSPNWGFIRKSAILAVVLVTDELDCSVNTDVYSPAFAKGSPFYPDLKNLQLNYVCLHAGTECTPELDVGDPGNYDECKAVNYGVDGKEIGNEGDALKKAVLHPVSRYVQQIETIEKQKKDLNADQEVVVALIGGVVPDGQGTVAYRPPQNNEENLTFGINYGCSTTAENLEEVTPDGTGTVIPAGKSITAAMPPIRLKKFVESFNEEPGEGLYSICDDDFTTPLRDIAKKIESMIRPACFSECVEDSDEDNKDGRLTPNCTVEERSASSEGSVSIKECQKDSNGDYEIKDDDYVLPGDALVCYAMLTDSTKNTKSVWDDMDPECAMGGKNLQFKLKRKKGVKVPAGTAVSASCQLSNFPDEDCPNYSGLDLSGEYIIEGSR